MSPDSPRYLDYAASAPIRPEALAAERDYESAAWAGANPNSLHSSGRAAFQALGDARRSIAKLLGCGFRPNEVVFCSGGTEANNLALAGISEGVRERDRKRERVIISAIEHDSVLEMAQALRSRGFAVDVAGVNRLGFVEPETLEGMLGDDVALVSIMYANNETGVIQPIDELAGLCKRRNIHFHTDAVQAFCRVPLELANVSAVSLTGHKIGAPVGIGALAIRSRVPLKPQSFGGGQEEGRRAGTQDVRGAMALARVAESVHANMPEAREETLERSRELLGKLLEHPRIKATTDIDEEHRLAGIVNILVEGLDSESLVLGLDQAGFEVSAGSACSSASLKASHVLLAMGIPSDVAYGSLRISFDERVAQEALDGLADALFALI